MLCKFNRTLLLIVVMVLSVAYRGHAEHFYYKKIFLQAGLPSTIRDIVRDERGFVWLATKSGLGRFDGHELKRYIHRKDDPKSLPSNYIYQVVEDARHNLWVLTEKGVSLYRHKSDDFTLLTDGDGVAIIAYSAYVIPDGIFFGSQKKVYFYDYAEARISKTMEIDTSNEEGFNVTTLSLWDPQTLLCCNRWRGLYLYDIGTGKTSLPHFDSQKDISSMFVDSVGQLWISFYNNGLQCYDRAGTLTASYTTADSELSSNIVLSIAERKNRIWVGTDGGGICILDPDSGQFTHLKHMSGDENYSLPANSIFCLYNDQYNNMWIGSIHDGLISIREVYMKTHTDVMPGSNLGLSYNTVLSLYRHPSGRVWIGTNGGGLNCFDPATKKFTHYASTWGRKVASICGFADDRLLLSVFSEGVFIFDPSTGRRTPFTIIDEATTMRLCTHGNTVNLYRNTPETVLLLGDQAYVYDMVRNKFIIVQKENDLEINAGTLLPIGHTQTHTYFNDIKSVFRLDHDSWRLSIVFSCKGDEVINSVSYDEHGNFWIGSNSGLKYYDHRSDVLNDIPTSLFTEVTSLICDHRGKVWIGAENMLFSWLIAEEKFVLFGESDGALQNEYLPKPRLVSPSGEVYMGGVQGLLQIGEQATEGIPRLETLPSLQLSGVVLNGELANNQLSGNPTGISVPAKSNIAIRIMSNEEDIFRQKHYRYLIEGLDDKYTESYNPELEVRSLPPGDYKIIVSCTDKDGSWTADQQILALTVLPPWYQSWWFIMVCVLLISATILWTFQRTLKRKKDKLLWAMKEHEQQTYEEKVRFLINISHELRTPLTLIYAPLSRILKSLSPDDAQYQPLKLIYRQSQRMKDLINMVLDVRKMEVGESKIQLQPHTLNEWLEGLSQDFASEGAAKIIDFRFKLDQRIENVSFDKEKCEIILSNLLINALKHSPENTTITITSELLADEGNVRISISDQGEGLEGVDKQRLFTRFYQGTGSQSGTGIGLSYSRILAELHGGSLGALDNADRGATFFFELPLTAGMKEIVCQPKAYLNELMSSDGDDGSASDVNAFDTSAFSILIVDDNANMTDFLKTAMADHFKQVIVASDGVEAQQLARSHTPDIILSDVMMPRMNGYELCKNIKEDIAISHIPVILLTARGDKKSLLSGYKNGADAYLTKPFEVDVLMALLRNKLGNREITRKRYLNAGIIPSPKETAFSSADETFLLKLNKTISENLDNSGLDVPFICKQIGVSRASLYNKLKALTDMGANEYINKFRMEKAISLIACTDMSFSEASERTGFSTLSYFSRVFKQYTGKSPSQFREDRQR